VSTRLVILINDALTNDSRVFKEARSLRGAGYEVCVFGNQQPGGGLERHFRKDGCDYYRPSSYPRSALRRRAWWNLQAARFAAHHRPTVILNHRWNTLIPAALGSYATGAPIVYDNRELFGGGNFDQKGAVFRQTFWLFERILVRACTEVIMSSRGRAEAWARKYRRRLPRVLYDCTEKREIFPNNTLREEYHLGPEDKLLIYVGGFGPGRGMIPSVEALAKLPSNYHFVALGYGTAFGELAMRRSRQLGVEERLHLHLPVPYEQIPSYISCADLSLCLIEPISRSYIESVPQKFYESLQAGVPVLASAFPEMRRLVEAHQVGLCVKPTDAEAIAAAVLRLTTDPDIEGWRARCFKAADVLTWENEVEQLLTAVEHAALKRRSRTST
jgi:glycosyltransferase involved in cell wall biosynthesis